MTTAELLVALQALSGDALVGFIAYLVSEVVGSLIGGLTVIAVVLAIRSGVLRYQARDNEMRAKRGY